MTWLEFNDDPHSAVTTGRAALDVDAGEFKHKRARSFQAGIGTGDVCEQFPDPGQALLLGLVGKEPEGTDTHAR